MDHGDFLFVG